MAQKKIFVIAGEASGDILAASVIRQLKNKGCIIKGLGGAEMEKVGVKSIASIAPISVMGIMEVIPNLFKIKKLFKKVMKSINRFKPDCVLTVDSTGFNFMIAKELRKQNYKGKVIHFVSPQIWAWKEKRKYKVAKLYDELLCLFSFEKPYYKGLKLKVQVVGHPIVEQGADMGNAFKFKRRNKIKDNSFIFGILPGSRMSEVSKLLPVFLETAKNIYQKHKDALFVIPVLPNTKKFIKEEVKKYKLPIKIVEVNKHDRYDMFAALNGAISASGTVSLELGLARVPHCISYKINALTYFMVRLLIKVKYANIFNLLANRFLVKEYIQNDCNVKDLTEFGESLFDKRQTAKMKENLKYGVQLLRANHLSPSRKAAREILKEI